MISVKILRLVLIDHQAGRLQTPLHQQVEVILEVVVLPEEPPSVHWDRAKKGHPVAHDPRFVPVLEHAIVQE
jgi:hypothetical protein